MLTLLVALQIAAATPPQASPNDSATLVAHARDVEFRYMMDWRQEWEAWRVDLWRIRNATPRLDSAARAGLPRQLLAGGGPEGTAPFCHLGDQARPIKTDSDQLTWAARIVESTTRIGSMSECPGWLFQSGPVEPGDEQRGIDTPLPDDVRDTVRARRVPVLELLDSAARLLPGDAWLAGQRVRMHMEQQEPELALAAATECRAAAWWCGMLRGYVRFYANDEEGAEAVFDSAQKRMPADTLCHWNDVSMLLLASARAEYDTLTCAEQAAVNARVWWLATPLYVVAGNPRRTEQYARRVLAELHAANDADERDDWRDAYAGPGLREMVLRYGWPTTMWWNPPPPYHSALPGWGRFDTHDTYLGLIYAPPLLARPCEKAPHGCPPPTLINKPRATDSLEAELGTPWRSLPLYWGPQFHTVPSWNAITDPLHATVTDWDIGPQLGPMRGGMSSWDRQWWAPEFYRRDSGPLIQLPSQVAFFRRSQSAVIAAATVWDSRLIFLPAPERALLALITSGGPDEKAHIIGTRVDGARAPAILTPVESRPLLFGLEMVPINDSGPAGRTRFAIDPLPRLTQHDSADLATSDPVLVRVTPDSGAPKTMQEMLLRMYGTTRLVNPKQVALFWEVYGQRDRDTVNVELRIVRADSAGRLARAAAAIGIGHVGADSLNIRWSEPAPDDPLSTIDSGVTIRPRGITVDMSALQAGDYTIQILVHRPDATAVSRPRELSIVGR